ncbi:MAG: hypothetical protein HGA36_01310 [Candidatus Moranbacteria bacterium]|nr:hypothetical protein [Candidatus Moranbacteria bacterium]
MIIYESENKKGYVVISTVLILLFVTLGIAATLSFLSIGSSKVSQSFGEGRQALFLSESCLEEGLLRLKTDVAYAGGTINFPEEKVCHLNITNDGQIYTMQAYMLGQKKYVRSLEVHVNIVDGILQIISWEEKPFVIEY